MLRFKLVALSLVWIASLAVLIITLNDSFAGNPLEKHKFVTWLFFWVITAYIGRTYKHIFKIQ